MNILALEFSSEQRSAAVVQTRPGGLSQVVGSTTTAAARTVQALSLIDQALRQANARRDQVEGIVVGLGPGSYTGIRVAIAVAQAWQLARGVALWGVSSADGIAAQARHAGCYGTLHVVIDAQRNEFYHAVYEVSAVTTVELSPLRLARRDEIERLAANGALVVGPEAERRLPAGRVVFPHAAVLVELLVRGLERGPPAGRQPNPSESAVPEARAAGLTGGEQIPTGPAAFQEGGGVSGEKLEPIYLRETSFVKAPPSRRAQPGP